MHVGKILRPEQAKPSPWTGGQLELQSPSPGNGGTLQ